MQRDTCHGDGWMRSRGVDWGSYLYRGIWIFGSSLAQQVVIDCPTREDRRGWSGYFIGMPKTRAFGFGRKAIK